MITINLLPESSRKPMARSIGPLVRSPLAYLIGMTLVGLAVGLGGIVKIQQLRVKQFVARLAQLEVQATEANQLTAAVKLLNDQRAVYERVDLARSQWGARLNILSDQLPDEIWLTELEFDPSNGLVIHGVALSHGGQEIVQLERFAKDLKANPVFSAAIRDLQLKSVKSVQEQAIELVEFILKGEPVKTPTTS